MWKYHQPVEIYFGEGVLDNLGSILKEKDFTNILLVCDNTSKKLGIAKRIEALVEGGLVHTFSDVQPNPTVENIDACLKEIEGKSINAVLALGGGSSMDCAKAISACIKLKISGSELLDLEVINEALPIVCIPTTAGTASEVTKGAVISDHARNMKKAIFGPAIFAKVAIDDPTLTYTCPDFVTASSGIDVLAHALDSLMSVNSTPATIGSAVYAAKLCLENLEKAYDDGNNVEARNKMMEACLVAGLAFSQTGTTGSHACSYYITSEFNIPHGEACAFTLDWWIEKCTVVRPELDVYANMMGYKDTKELAKKIREIKKHIGLRTTLTELGGDESQILPLVDSALQAGNMSNSIWQASKDDLVAMFKSRV